MASVSTLSKHQRNKYINSVNLAHLKWLSELNVMPLANIIEANKLAPRQQALLPKHRLTTKAGWPKKGRQKNGKGLDPILEHHDIKADPYCAKPLCPRTASSSTETNTITHICIQKKKDQ